MDKEINDVISRLVKLDRFKYTPAYSGDGTPLHLAIDCRIGGPIYKVVIKHDRLSFSFLPIILPFSLLQINLTEYQEEALSCLKDILLLSKLAELMPAQKSLESLK